MDPEMAREDPARDRTAPEYDPPAVERVVRSEEIQREVHYAGTQVSEGTPG